MDQIIHLNTVKDYNDYLGITTDHPLVSVVDASKIGELRHARKNMGFYAVYLKDVKCADFIIYGRRKYDFQENTLVFVAPGQIVGNDDTGETFQPKGWWLMFQPELLHGTSLGNHMQEYTFFSYAVNEALHISKQERQTVIDCMKKIEQEIKATKDKHSRLIIASTIELLLNYCLRFYDRQFHTRQEENKGILSSFESLLNHYFLSDKLHLSGIPTVSYCAEMLHLSANYFGDLIKKETGRSAQTYILWKAMSVAKELLADPRKNVSDVAYALGYQHPQYFSRAFKRIVGCSPNEYRLQQRLQ